MPKFLKEGNQLITVKEMPKVFEEFSEPRKQKFMHVRKLKEAGKNVVGTFCTYTPKEILYAADIVTVGLCGVSQEPIPAAERDLPENLCPLIKSSYGHAITDTCPYFYFCDMVLGETTCDGKKKMYELLGDIKDTHVMMLPQTSKLENGVELFISEMERLIEKVEEKFGVEITEEKLKNAIHESNENRRNFTRLLELSKLKPAPFRGVDMVNILESYDFCFSSTEKNDMVNKAYEKAIQEYESIKNIPERKSRKRLLMTGCPNAGVKDKVTKLFDEKGVDIVVIDACNGIKEKKELIDETLPPLEALARKYINVSCSVMAYNERRIDDIGSLIEEYQIDGVIEVILQACHTFQIEALRVERFVRDEKQLPYLKISTDYSQNDAGQISTRVEAFVEML